MVAPFKAEPSEPARLCAKGIAGVLRRGGRAGTPLTVPKVTDNGAKTGTVKVQKCAPSVRLAAIVRRFQTAADVDGSGNPTLEGGRFLPSRRRPAAARSAPRRCRR